MSRQFAALFLALLIAAGTVSAPLPKGAGALPKGATARLGSLAFRDTSRPCRVSFSLDGKTLHSFNAYRLRCWEFETGALLADNLSESVSKLGISGEFYGDRLCILQTEPLKPGMAEPIGTLLTLNRHTGAEISRIPFRGNIYFAWTQRPYSAAVAPDGRYAALVSRTNKTVEVFDLDTGKKLHAQPLDPAVGGSVISPDNKTLYVLDRTGPVRRCELLTGKPLPDLAGTDRTTDRLLVSPDGRRVVTGKGVAEKDRNPRLPRAEDTLTVHDAATNTPLHRIELGATAMEFVFAGPDAILVLGRRQKPPLGTVLARWNVATAKKEWEEPLPQSAEALSVSQDGKRAVWNTRHSIQPIDPKTGKPLVEVFAHAGGVFWVMWSPDGQSVHTADSHNVMTWTIKGERRAVASPSEFRGGTFSQFAFGEPFVWTTPDAAGTGWDIVGWETEKRELAWRVPVGPAEPARLYTHDGKRIVGLRWAEKTRKWTATVYDGTVGRVRSEHTLPAGQGDTQYSVPPVALTGDGKRLFVAGVDVQALDLATGTWERISNVGPTQSVSASSPMSFAVSADGARFAIVERVPPTRPKPVFSVYESKSGKRLVSDELALPIPTSLVFDPSGRRLAVWSFRSVVVYDVETAAKPLKLDADAWPSSLAFSPNGKSLAVGYQDGTTLLWDLTAK